MNKTHLVLLHLLLFVMSAQMVAYQVGWIPLAPVMTIVCLSVLPYLNERWGESMMIIRPLIVSVGGLSFGLALNFFVGNFRMNTYTYCILTSVVSYIVSVGILVVYRKWLVLKVQPPLFPR